MAKSDYPEHERLTALNGLNDRIGEFIEWMQDEQGWSITRWTEHGNNGEPRYLWKEGRTIRKQFGKKIRPDDIPDSVDEYNGDAEFNPAYESWPSGYYPVRESIPNILALYFKIDQDKLEREKRAMLDAIRKDRKAS